MTDAPDSTPSIDPAGLTSTEFSRVRKGYEPLEVRALLERAAAAISSLTRERDDLVRRVAALEQQAETADEDLDEARIAKALGEETVRVIEAARGAATEIRSKAEERAARLVRDAQEEAERLRAEAAATVDRSRGEAESMLDAARVERDRLAEEAHRERDELLERAGAVLGERTAEAEEVATGIRGEAESTLAAALEEAETARVAAASRAAEILDDATARAAEHLEEVRAQGRAMLEETRELRQRILRDIAARRRTARMQLEAARAGRERLVDGVATVRTLLEDVSRELEVALPEARTAADAAARDVVDDLAEVATELGDGLSELVAPDLDGPAEPGVGAWSDLPEPVVIAEPTLPSVEDEAGLASAEESDPAEDESVEDRAPATDEPDEPAVESPREVTRPFPVIPLGEIPGGGFEEPPVVEGVLDEESVDGESVDEESVDAESVDAALTDESAEEPTSEVTAEEPQAEDTTSRPSPPYLLVPAEEPEAPARVPGSDAMVINLADHRLRTDTAEEVEDGEDGETAEDEAVESAVVDLGGRPDDTGEPDDGQPEDEADTASDGAVAESTLEMLRGAPDPVGDLFARLRAGSSGAAAAAVLAEPPPAAEPPIVEPEVAAASMLDAEELELGDETLLDARDHLIAPLERSLARHLKRLISDDQNEVLDRLRRARRGGPQPVAFPDVEAVARRYGDALAAELRSVVAAGADHWATRGGASRPLDPATVAADLDERVRRDVVDALVQRIERAVEDGRRDGDDPGELAERVRAACREWRTTRVPEVAGDLAIAAFNLGILAGAAEGAEARWVVDHGGLPCADGEDNALAPPTPCGAPFPTGHACAPAHPGCRCILVPVRR